MKPLTKVGIVLGGYFLAFALSAAVVASYMAITSGPASQASGGMAAFGDMIMFIALFAIAAVPPTGAALYFLRPVRAFWTSLSVLAGGVALTALAAIVTYFVAQRAGAYTWSGVALLRFLVGPIFAAGFLLAGLIAPNNSSRITLFAAAATDAVAVAGFGLLWFFQF